MFVLDLKPVRGDTFSNTIRLKDKTTGEPLDLSQWSWLAQARKDADADTVMATITVDTTRAAQGILTLSIPSATTETMSAGVWDLQGTNMDDGRVKTFGKGTTAVQKDVSRSTY